VAPPISVELSRQWRHEPCVTSGTQRFNARFGSAIHVQVVIRSNRRFRRPTSGQTPLQASGGTLAYLVAGVAPRVSIRVDLHEQSVTIEVVDNREKLLGWGRYPTDRVGYALVRSREDVA
jgi:hypothetical protein